MTTVIEHYFMLVDKGMEYVITIDNVAIVY